jgi:hypothetical protein
MVKIKNLAIHTTIKGECKWITKKRGESWLKVSKIEIF